jgi:hypothetical protein
VSVGRGSRRMVLQPLSCRDTHGKQSLADQRHSSGMLMAFIAIALMYGVKRAAMRSDIDDRCFRFEF